MLNHPTPDQLHQLGLIGMARAFAELEADTEAAPLAWATSSPSLRRAAASLPTAARERAGSFEEITTAAFSSSTLDPAAKTPPEPIQLV